MRGYFPEYQSVAEKKAKAAKAAAKLLKKDPEAQPVRIEGTKLAKTWWATAWNQNLERYSDYSNRLGRGKSYVRQGMVIDLRIAEGLISAQVVGSARTPYCVVITVDKLSPSKWQKLSKQCANKLGGLSELLSGKFPEELRDLFFDKSSGLFPSPKEIHMDCSCPDWAEMCKHVAAVLYGVGARLDENPLLFFTLRGIPFQELLQKTADEKVQSLLQNAGKKTKRTLDASRVTELFGVELK
ncbi:MAG: hypothetical protein RSD76_03360 [Clostridia bacterium]